ncbi:LysE family transporter [Nesterenkonia alkaliphila]|uniref:LysE family transporter n=1 Tax=Nesterenkonia alkaliphila TaxID=1463631 RepID=A0A7K1UJK6_9MICC|nr:LysE family transporter [Nesterenkonia alkaliphila]MVT26675.1 LysE family transporter [Nesterenkonia alkaliphila]GFZ77911.1 chemotactic transduction protein ChpE [Nesterenkonia alkaliphila]
MIQIVLTGLWLGLVFNAAPGPVFTESLRRGVRGGFRPAFAVQVGSLVGDAVWAVLGLAGAAALLTQPQWHIPITLAGCLVLLFLGAQGTYAAVRPGAAPVETPSEVPAQDTRPGNTSTLRGPLVAGALMSLGSVWNVVYWGGAGGAVGGALGEGAPLGSLLVFFAAFMVSSLLWCFICAGLIAGLRRAMSQRWTRIVEGGAGAALIIMAIALALQTFGT